MHRGSRLPSRSTWDNSRRRSERGSSRARGEVTPEDHGDQSNSSETVTGAAGVRAPRRRAGDEMVAVTRRRHAQLDSACRLSLGAYCIRSCWTPLRSSGRAVRSRGFGASDRCAKEALTIPWSPSPGVDGIACLPGHRVTTSRCAAVHSVSAGPRAGLRLEAKCASVRAINVNVEQCVTDRERTLRELTEQIRGIVAEDRAEAMVIRVCSSRRRNV